MNEVEKMYEKAEPNRNCNLYKHFTECPMKHTQCEDCENFIYPPFTAEKQIELIKWLARYNFIVCKNLGGWHTGINPTYDEDFGITCSKRATNFGSFEYALAGFINTYWQGLTEEERTQIKEILE